LAGRPGDGTALESVCLKARLGEMLLKQELLEAMSRATSLSTGRPYGLALVCRIW
jgi:hypothetical protein